MAAGLIQVFSGRGVVPDEIARTTPFLTAVDPRRAGTVMLATVTGFPISTTHALTGAIIGAGLMAVGTEINVATLGSAFFAPLLLSPLLSVCLTAPLYMILKRLKGGGAARHYLRPLVFAWAPPSRRLRARKAED